MTSAAAFFGRIFWMIADPILLAVLALNIAHQGTGWFTLIDLAYFFVLAGMLLGKWLEFRSAMTGMGEPATVDHLRRYLVATSTVGLGLGCPVCAVFPC